MKQIITVALLLAASSAVLAVEPQKKDAEQAVKIDNYAACYYGNVAYSKGAVIAVGDKAIQCVRTATSKFDKDDSPLEWKVI